MSLQKSKSDTVMILCELQYCKTRIFRLHKFRDLGNITKLMGHEYLKSHAILVYYLVQQSKNAKTEAKIV